MWSVHERTLNDDSRTNNFVEAFHRSLQRQFAADHPGLLKFIDGLRKAQVHKDAQLEHYVAGCAAAEKRNRYLQNDLRILRIMNRRDSYALIEFLRGIAHTYEMNP
ncbi:uncharacterized protein LOC108863775 [Galendromus occidentalis]|uniref:Uncharacterized protein LOC108863775 n=1 Tax=Galendromus occidentalis TaxID=34638 RepID=A0AAJ7P933_9ACAR|nr:uncharacterized protein LOC108863775 [Galendromus occidentalis]